MNTNNTCINEIRNNLTEDFKNYLLNPDNWKTLVLTIRDIDDKYIENILNDDDVNNNLFGFLLLYYCINNQQCKQCYYNFAFKWLHDYATAWVNNTKLPGIDDYWNSNVCSICYPK